MSTEGLAALLLLVAALMALALWRSHQAARQLAALDAELRRAEVAGQEQTRRIAALETLRDGQQLTEHAIATGTAVVKEMHKGIADIPFSVLEAIPGVREPAKLLRGLHDSISDGVYGALGHLNKAVGRELRKGVPLADASPEEIPAQPNQTTAPDRGDDDPSAPGAPKSWG